MEIQSSAFGHNQMIPQKYTCDGANVNPPLMISGVPEGMKSLVLLCDDPDAPSGDWVHWLVWNIDPKTQQIEEDSLPVGAVEGMTSFGSPDYGGPCPPSGTHRYFFRVYALDVVLDLMPEAGKDELFTAMEGHILDEGELIGKYSRAV